MRPLIGATGALLIGIALVALPLPAVAAWLLLGATAGGLVATTAHLAGVPAPTTVAARASGAVAGAGLALGGATVLLGAATVPVVAVLAAAGSAGIGARLLHAPCGVPRR